MDAKQIRVVVDAYREAKELVVSNKALTTAWWGHASQVSW